MNIARRWFGICLALALGLLPVVVWLAGGIGWASEPVWAGSGVELALVASKEGTVTLGEYITYTMMYTIPAGINVPTSTLKSCLPDNSPSATKPDFRYVINSWEGPIAIGDTPAISDVIPTGDNHCRTWALPPINTGETDHVYHIRYVAQVFENYARSTRGQVGIANAEFQWHGTEITDTVGLTITTPDMDSEFYIESPDGVIHRPGFAVRIRELKAGDTLTLTIVFANEPDDYVQSAYDALVYMYIPDFITYTAIEGTPDPKQFNISILRETYIGMLWDKDVDTHLSEIEPGTVITYEMRLKVADDAAPDLSSDVYGFGLTQASSTRSRFKTIPQSDKYYAEFIRTNPTISFLTSPIIFSRETQGGFLDTQETIFAGPGDTLIYTVSYTLPSGTTIHTPAYFEDSLPGGLIYGGVVTYPTEIFTGVPQIISGDSALLQWHFTDTLILDTDVVHTFVYTATLDSRYSLKSTQTIPRGQPLIASARVGYTYNTLRHTSPEDATPVIFSRPHYGDTSSAGILGRFGKCLIGEEGCDEALNENAAIAIQGGGFVTFKINHLCNGGFTTDETLINATLTAYNTVITDTLPPAFEVVDAWPPGYHLVTTGDQQSVVWYENDAIPYGHCLPGVVTAEDKAAAPSYIVTATVPVTAVVGATYVNEVTLEYQDAVGSLYQDQSTQLYMIIDIDVQKSAQSPRDTDAVRVGEIMTYTIVNTIPPQGIAYGPMHRDILPPGIFYIPDTFQIEGGQLTNGSKPITSSTNAREQLTWTMEDFDNRSFPTPTYITITYQARVTGRNTDDEYIAYTLSAMEGATPLRSDTQLFWNGEDIPDPSSYEYSSKLARGTVLLHQPSFNTDNPQRGYFKTILTTTSGSHIVEAGDEATYHIFVKNTGLANAYNVVISDTLPTGMALVSYTAEIFDTAETPYTVNILQEPDPGSRDLVWEVEMIPLRPGRFAASSWGGLDLHYTARVSNVIEAGLVLSNAMQVMDYVSLPDADPHARHYGDLHTGVIKYAGPLTVATASLHKAAAEGVIRQETLVYTLTAPYPPIGALLYNVMITDVLDAFLAPLDAQAFSTATQAVSLTYGLEGQVFTATIPFLDTYEQITMIITTTARPTASLAIPNQAILAWTNQPEGGELFQSYVNVTTAVLDPDLVVTKSSPSPVDPGNTYTYTVIYQNIGQAIARDVVLTDVFPSEINYGGYYTTSRPISLTSPTTPTLVWALGDLEPGAGDTFYITATVPPTIAVGTEVTNEVEVSTVSLGDPPENNQDTESTLITRTTTLAMSMNPLATTTVPGTPLTYTLHYTIGDVVGQDIVLNSVYPPHVSFEGCDHECTSDFDTRTITWTLGTLAENFSDTVQFTVSVTSPLTHSTRLTHTASMDALNARPVEASASAIVESAPDLMVTQSASKDRARRGELFNYTVVYTNTGTDFARGTRITATYDSPFQMLSASPAPNVGNNVWTLGTLGQVSDSIVITGRLRANAPISYVTVSTVTLGALNSQPVQDQASVLVSGNELLVSASAPTTATPGTPLVYTVVYTAAGNEPSENVVLRLEYPGELSIVDTSPQHTTSNPQEVRWSLGNLAAGTTQQVLITTTVDSPLADGLALSGQVHLEAKDTIAAQQAVESTVSSAPELSLDKTVSDAVREPGEWLVYTITYANTGTDYAYNAVITETFAEHIDEITTAPAPDDGDNTWNLGHLGLSPGTIVITGQVQSDAPFPYTSTNLVTLSSDNAALLTATVPVTISDNFVALDMVAPANVDAGDWLTYTIVYTAGGSQPSREVTVRNTLPDHVSEVTATPAYTLEGETLIWRLGDLDEGTSEAITLTMRVTQPLTDGTELVSTAIITTLDKPSTQRTVTITVGSAPALALSKVASAARVQPGDTLIYTITYANTGNEVAHNVVITETYDEYVAFASAAPPPDNEDNNVWRIAHLGRESRTIVITVTVADNAPLEEPLHNWAALSADNAPLITNTIAVTISRPVLELSASAPPVVNAGEVLTYTLVYTAAGTEAAPDAMLRSLPTVYGTVVSTVPPTTTMDGDALLWELGDLPLGVTGTVQVSVRITSPLTDGLVLENTGEITARGAISDSARITTTTESAPALTLSKIASAERVQPGDTLVYTITYANTGNDAAREVVITEFYGDNLVFVSAFPEPDAGSNNVWRVGRLEPQPGTIVITMTVAEDAPHESLLTNRVTLTATGQPELEATAQTQVIANELLLTADYPAEVAAGELLTFTLAYTATGQQEIEAVVLTAHYPAHTTFESATPAPTVGNNGWSLGTLAAGDSDSVQVTLRVAAPLTNGLSLAHTATITSANAAPDSVTGTTVVRSAPELTLAKVTSAGWVPPGGTLVYTITYANTGNGYAQDVVITETYPAGLVDIVATPAPDVDNHVWQIGRLGQTSGEIVITARVEENTPEDSELRNRVTLTAEGQAPLERETETRVVTLYELTVTLEGQGSVQLSPPGPRYKTGEQVTLTPVAAPGWRFAGWSGDIEGDADPAQLTMNDDQQITATFIAKPVPTHLAGTLRVNLYNFDANDVLTYTIVLHNQDAQPVTAILTAPLPVAEYLTYVEGSARASLEASVNVTDGAIRWSGPVKKGSPVIIEYAMRVSNRVETGARIDSFAYLSDGQDVQTLTVRSLYNPGYRLSINKGALYTAIPTVTLDIDWNALDDIRTMDISNDGGFGTRVSVPVTRTYAGWLMQVSDDDDLVMPRTVYIRFRDGEGQYHGPFQDDIIYDPTPPVVSEVKILPGNLQIQSGATRQQVTLRVTTYDDNSGVSHIIVNDSNTCERGEHNVFSVTQAVQEFAWSMLNGEVYVCAVDRAGNVSESARGSGDITPPQQHIFLPLVLRTR